MAVAARRGAANATIIPVDERGQIDKCALEGAVGRGVDLLCIMAANNEVGTVTAFDEVFRITARTATRCLVDASQACGRIALDAIGANAHYIVLSGSKMYGPRRTGALIGSLGCGASSKASSLFGSPDAASASAMAMACTLRAEEGQADEARIAHMRDALERRLLADVPGLAVNGDRHRRLAGSLNVSAPYIQGEAVVARLWADVALSTGAACQSGAPGPSHVLTALGLPEWRRDGAIRIGVGKFNTEEEIDLAGDFIVQAVEDVAAASRMRA